MQSQLEILKLKLLEKQALNSRFSLRSFSRFLGVSPSHLSNVMKGHRVLTKDLAESICNRLDMSPLERHRFLSPTSPDQIFSPVLMSEQDFRYIADWYHLAILSLSKVKGAKANFAWIGKRLAISVDEAKDAVARLIELNLLQFDKSGFKQLANNFVAHSSLKNSAFRKFHTSMLAKAEDALVNLPQEERYFSTRIIAVEKDQMAEAIKMIKAFQDEFAARFGRDANGSRVHALSTQFYPIDKGEKQ